MATLTALLASGAFAALLWWAYFDRPSPGLEHAASKLESRAAGRYIRDVYTWAHAPIVAGVILAAGDDQPAGRRIGHEAHHGLAHRLDVALAALHGSLEPLLLEAAAHGGARVAGQPQRDLPRRQTGACAKHQRMLARAIKRARHLALMPFVG